MNGRPKFLSFAWWNLHNFAHFDVNKIGHGRWPKKRQDYEDKRDRILTALREVFNMSATSAEFELLLREAVSKAKEAAPRAIDDLIRCASKAAEAVAGVTEQAAALELVPVNQERGATPTYQLQFRKVGSEAPPSDLGIYRVTEGGYPVLQWCSRAKWDKTPDQPDAQFTTFSELEGNFKWMLSNPESRLVVLVTFFQQEQPAPDRESTTGKPTKRRK